MNENFYTSGQVGKQLGISSYKVRRLCEAGLITAEYSDSKQWLIPPAEVTRLGKDGVPLTPKAIDSEDVSTRKDSGANPKKSSNPTGLLAAPSDDLIASSEEVAKLQNRVQALGLQRQAETELDWFREREDREAERQGEQQELEQRRLAREQAEHKRQQWLREWESWAVEFAGRLTDESCDVQLAVQREVRDKLLALRPRPADDVTKTIIREIVVKHAEEWAWNREVLRIVGEARDRWLPVQARLRPNEPTEWQRRAVRAAVDSMNDYGKPYKTHAEVSIDELRSVARRAVEKIAAEFEHSQNCARLVNDSSLWGMTGEEQEAARKALTKALSAIPIGTSIQGLERVRDAALQPYRDAIAKRTDEEKAREQEADRKLEIEWTVTRSLSLVDEHVRQREAEGEVVFDNLFDRMDFEKDLREQIRPALVNELQKNPTRGDEYIQRRIEEFVDHSIEQLDDDLTSDA